MKQMNAGHSVIVGVILAAGMSSRMGQFKPVLPLGDTTFIKRIISMMRGAGVDEILVVSGAKRSQLEEHLRGENVKLLFNAQYESTQMLESVKLAIREAQRYADAILLTPVDVALPDEAVYRAIMRRFSDADCVRPVYRGRGGHPVLIGRRVFPMILGYEGQNGLKGALHEAGAVTEEVNVNHPGIVMDADTPEDYRQVQAFLGAQRDYIAVAGGLNIDIGGTALKPLVALDSNPGIVRSSLGGVARNIAHNLCLMGQRVLLFTAYGDDQYREMIEDSADVLGLDLSCSLCVPRASTATYLFLNEPDGNLSVAVNDMQICSFLTPAYFEKHLEKINGAKLLILDANLPKESIAYLMEHVQIPVFADMVSAAKAGVFLPYLSKLHTLKANVLEAEVLSGVQITDEQTRMEAAQKLHQEGVWQVFLSCGKDGMLAVGDHATQMVGACRSDPVNMTGAGDASLAALAIAYLQGMNLEDMARYANAAAAIAIESKATVNEKISITEIENRVKEDIV